MKKNEWSKVKVFLLFIIILCNIPISGYGGELVNAKFDSFGSWFQKNWINNGSSISVDSTSPDPPNVLKFYFPSGYLGGNSPATVGFKIPNPVQEYYVQYYFKYSSNWEFHPVADKQMYIYTEPSHSDSHCAIMTHWGSLVFSVGGPSYPDGSRSFKSNPSFTPVRGRWYKLTLHAKMNNPRGTANGIAELWIDDVKIINATNVMYLLSNSSDSGFQSFNFSPVYGGAGSQKTHDDYVYFDKAIISTSPISGSSITGQTIDNPIPDKVPATPKKVTIQ